jgi:tRNA(Ile)-lysidine synthase
MLAAKERAGGAGQIFAAHLNHGLRGSAADEDTDWLKILCERWMIPLETGRLDVAAVAKAQGDGWEAAARAARYEFLRLTAEKLGARYVVVAHHADDQTETVLHRILRGTGLAGLSGMPRVRSLSAAVSLIRPLLEVRRSELLRYLQVIDQDYRPDSSNSDRRWTRNRLRTELLPALRKDYNVEVDEALRRLAQQAGEAQQLISRQAYKLANQSIELFDSRPSYCVRINCTSLVGESPIVVSEVCRIAWAQAGFPLQSMGFDRWQQLSDLANGPPNVASVNLPGNIQAARDGSWLVLGARLGRASV